MKINSITTNTAYLKNRTNQRSMTMERECANIRHNLNEYNNDQINTTIKRNSDGRVSFKGGAPLLHKIAKFTGEYPLVAEALFALVITCGARPLTILATAKTDEDKEKCSYQAAKSISSGLVGLAMTALVGTVVGASAKTAHAKGFLNHPTVRKGIEELKNFASNNKTDANKQLNKLIEKVTKGNKLDIDFLKDIKVREEFFNLLETADSKLCQIVKEAVAQEEACPNYLRTCKNVIDKLFQPIFMPIRATITTALVPVILNSMGIKKTVKKPQQTTQAVADYSMFQTEKEKELFKPFMEVANNARK